MQPIIIWVLLLVAFLIEIVLLYLAATKQAGKRLKQSGLMIRIRLDLLNLVLLLFLFIAVYLAIAEPTSILGRPVTKPAVTLTAFLVFCLVYLVFSSSLAIQEMLQPEEKYPSAQDATQDSLLRKSWVWGGLINGLLLLGLGLLLTDLKLAQPLVFSGAFLSMLARPVTQVVLVLLALLGIYPLIYIAYRQVYSKVHQTRLGEDFQLLGIYTEDEAQSKAEELYNIVYSNRQYIWFIALILLFSILILVVYGFIDQLKAVDLAKIGLDYTVRSLVFFAYLGAYVFSVQELVRRYNTEDLRPQVFSSILGRMLVATVVVYVAAHILLLIQPPEPNELTLTVAPPVVSATTTAEPTLTPEPENTPASEPSETEEATEPMPAAATPYPDAPTEDGDFPAAEPAESQEPTETPTPTGVPPAEGQTNPCPPTTGKTEPTNPPTWWAAVLAFFIGIFPKSGIQWLQNLARNSINTLPAEVNALPVRNLQGISSLHEARLEEMGIDDVQNLAFVDIRKLLLITRFDTQEIINWIDQAILYTKVGNKYDRFREQGILTFHQLVQRLSTESVQAESQADSQKPAAGQAGDEAAPANEAGASTDSQAAQTGQKIKLHELALSLNVTDDALKFLSNEGDFPNYAFIKQYYLHTPGLARERASEGRSRLSTLRREGAFEQVDVRERWIRVKDEALAILKVYPSDADALSRLGNAQFKLGETEKDWEEARKTLSKAIEIDPLSPDKFVNLAGVCVALKKWDEAIQNATRAIELEQNNKEAYAYLGQAYASKDFNALALAQFDRALELDDHYGVVFQERGFLHNKLSAFQQAIDDFLAAYYLLRKTEHKKLWFEWGAAYLDRGRQVESEQPGLAIDHYKKAVEKLSKAIAWSADSKCLGRRGLANYLLGQLEPAIQDFERSLKDLANDAPERIKYLYFLALAYLEAQNTDQACKMFSELKKAAQPNSWYAVQADIYLQKTGCPVEQPQAEGPDQPSEPQEGAGEGSGAAGEDQAVGPAETAEAPGEENAAQPGEPAETAEAPGEENAAQPGEPAGTVEEPGEENAAQPGDQAGAEEKPEDNQ
jgi:tetratricopeptide (TPR) repeat protein